MQSADPSPSSPTGSRTDIRGPFGLALLLVAGLAIRIALAPIEAFVYDRKAFTEWMIALQQHPLAEFYHLPLHVPADHLPGTLWLLRGLGTLAVWMGVANDRVSGFTITPADAQPFLKALPILADLVVGLLIFAIVRQVTPTRQRAALFAAGSWILEPGVIFVSAVWGQWDSISLVFMLAAMWCALRGQSATIAVPPLIALAMLMKPQFVILAPIIAGFLLITAIPQRDRTYRSGEVTIRQIRGSLNAIWRTSGWRLLLGGGIAVGLVTLAGWPFRVGLLPFAGWMTYADRVQFAADRFHGTTYGAVSLWIIPLGTRFPPSDTERIVGTFTAAQIGWALVAASAVAGFVIAHRARWSAFGLIAGSAVTYLGFTLFATRMHERYLMPGLALALLLAGIRPALRTIVPTIALSLAYFASVYCSYTSFSFNPHLPLRAWRTGTLLSSLGAIGILAFITIAVSVWFMAAPRRRPITHARSAFPVTPVDVGAEVPSGNSSQGALP